MADTTTPASTLERLLGSSEPVRRALYPVVVAVVALLVAYGLLDAERVPLWLALAVAILGPGSIEAARAVAYAPATHREQLAERQTVVEAAYAQGIADGLGQADDEPGQHAADRARDELPTELLHATGPLAAQDAPTSVLRAQSRTTRCREVDGGRRCKLTRDHDGPHLMTTG